VDHTRFLVVDDFEPWRRLVCAMLKGHAEIQVVGEASDGFEAVRMAEELRSELILLRHRVAGRDYSRPAL
jgi:chemotaxis response regulator CheB